MHAGRFPGLRPRLNADQFCRVIVKAAENPERIGTTSDTGINPRGQPFLPVQDLPAGLPSDNGLKIGYHLGKRVGTACGPQDIVGIIHVGGPVAQCRIDGIF